MTGDQLGLGGNGVFSDSMLEEAINTGWIAGEYRIDQRQIQPASVDLTLGQWAHRLRCSFLSDKEPVEAKLKELSDARIDLRKDTPGILEPRVPYLVELREQLNLPSHVRAKANPKSSTGRLDVFTRVITDRSFQYDEIAAGYRGKLYLEIVPISFPIRISEGMSLNQLRLISGAAPTLTDEEIMAVHKETPLLFRRDGRPVKDVAINNGLFIGLDLRGDDHGAIGYKARRSTRLLKLTDSELANPRDFWEPVYREPDGEKFVLEPEEFYLLMSNEHVRIPPHLASEMIAYDPTSGELRTHYAGFFDPGFGHSAGRRATGSRAALEVRAHDVPFMIEHGQTVCKLSFERMQQEPARLYGTAITSNYQHQNSTLSKYFSEWSGEGRLILT